MTSHERGPVLLVDDDLHSRQSAAQMLGLAGFEVTALDRAVHALPYLEAGWGGIVLSDVKMPHMTGLQFLDEVQRLDDQVPIILMTGHGDLTMAVQAMRDGAYDFIEKPFSSDLLIDTCARAMEKVLLRQENRDLRRRLQDDRQSGSPILGQSQKIAMLRQRIDMIAQTNVDALIVGETGSGKDLIARHIHEKSPRGEGPFVVVNCAALPEAIFDSELFGHEPDAFPATPTRRIGKIEHAQSGTLLFDDVDHLPLPLQAKLLRVIEERSLERLGSNETIHLDVRILTTTQVDLAALVEKGHFRNDLFYRLSGMIVEAPALRECPEDIIPLLNAFAEEAAQRFDRPFVAFLESHLEACLLHEWRGNVRELRHFAENHILSQGQNSLAMLRLPAEDTNIIVGDATLPQKLEIYEKILITQALNQAQGRIKDALDILGIPRKTLNDKMRKYGLERRSFIANEKK